MAILVGVVIIGGIRRIAKVAERIVPIMAIVYVTAALIIIGMHYTMVPWALKTIVTSAFNPDAAYGGFIGVLVMGFRRAAFSNEAGAGSAAIAHSAARTPYPVREGIVALLEPFIDTVVICTMTALVIVITGAYANPAYADIIAGSQGAALTSRAMGEHLTFFPYILSFAVFLFAYSTMISWSYYGERCWVWLFGEGKSIIYRVIFLVFVFLGSIITATNILDFGDLMILGMAFPNLLGVYLLQGHVRKELDGYWAKLKSGEIKRYK
jgi:alanine or glycine:cation symporter, AGCS family